jgi:hypothetical protein
MSPHGPFCLFLSSMICALIDVKNQYSAVLFMCWLRSIPIPYHYKTPIQIYFLLSYNYISQPVSNIPPLTLPLTAGSAVLESYILPLPVLSYQLLFSAISLFLPATHQLPATISYQLLSFSSSHPLLATIIYQYHPLLSVPLSTSIILS